MDLNPDKYSFMLSTVDDEFQTNLLCGNETLKNSKQEKVLGVTIDNKLNFVTHLLNITKNAKIKINALTNQKNIYSLHLLNRSSLMFCIKNCIGRINSIYERCLSLIQQNYISDFEVLLQNANEKPVHQNP